jgi:hypothetical protein
MITEKIPQKKYKIKGIAFPENMQSVCSRTVAYKWYYLINLII